MQSSLGPGGQVALDRWRGRTLRTAVTVEILAEGISVRGDPGGASGAARANDCPVDPGSAAVVDIQRQGNELRSCWSVGAVRTVRPALCDALPDTAAETRPSASGTTGAYADLEAVEDGSATTRSRPDRPFREATDTLHNAQIAAQDNVRIRRVDASVCFSGTVVGKEARQHGFGGDGGSGDTSAGGENR